MQLICAFVFAFAKSRFSHDFLMMRLNWNVVMVCFNHGIAAKLFSVFHADGAINTHERLATFQFLPYFHM